MISYLNGTVKWLDLSIVIIDVSGVGYEAICSSNTLGDLQENEKTALWIYTHVREDALQLFGFSTQVEKKFFESLLKVNGIGPKMAIQILSGASLDRLIDFIEQQDVKSLCLLPKVGKKIAEQMILTLRGKLVFENQSGPSVGDELTSALSNLGFKNNDIHEVVKKIDRKAPFEDQLRKALTSLGGQR
jgi:holliday junction DNA helicase RuvA